MTQATRPRYRRKVQTTVELTSKIDPHEQLLARWLLQMGLYFGWYRKPYASGFPEIMESEYFIGLTNIDPFRKVDQDGDLVRDLHKLEKTPEVKISKLFSKRLAELMQQSLPDDLPLIHNVDRFGARLGFDEADKAVLRFAVAMHSFREFNRTVRERREFVSNQKFAEVIALIFNQPRENVLASLGEESPLRNSGILSLEPGSVDLDEKLQLIEHLAPLLLMPDISEERLIGRFLRSAGQGSLDLDAYPHLNADAKVLMAYMRNALTSRIKGGNVLFYGLPGTGKTEFAKALAQELGANLYEVSFADENGDPIRGHARLRAYNLCQRFTASTPNALLMFDEIEDVLPSSIEGIFRTLFGGGLASSGSGKAWVNRTLERNPVPAIWITNSVEIDPAYLRRFDYSVRFSVPPHPVRMAMARRHFAEFAPTDAWLAKIASNEHVLPAQLERAARVACLAAPDDTTKALAIVEQTLDRSATLLDQKRAPVCGRSHTAYDLQFINTDVDVTRLVDGLKHRPKGTFCFYGPAGTGKSELGRHLADAIGKPALLRRASDILSMWVGGAEKNIAGMFAEARQRDAVLILDEADSFLADRRDAHASWEVTQVNELLTQMEAFEGIFICTTNLMQKLDQASLRRFAFKVKFDYLNIEQRQAMFLSELARLGGDVPSATDCLPQVQRLSQLTPGDFAVVSRQFDLWGTSPSAGELYEQLRKECVAKGAPARSIGFMTA